MHKSEILAVCTGLEPVVGTARQAVLMAAIGTHHKFSKQGSLFKVRSAEYYNVFTKLMAQPLGIEPSSKALQASAIIISAKVGQQDSIITRWGP